MEQQTPARQKVIFSGIQPTGTLTLGNYIGALRNFKLLEDDYLCLYCVVDLHAITLRQDAAALRKRCLDLAAIYLAVGLDPQKSLIYCQSHVPAHAELSWILNLLHLHGRALPHDPVQGQERPPTRTTSTRACSPTRAYAADILLYQADLVPVGVTRTAPGTDPGLAQRFNNLYGNVFTIPEVYIGKVGAR